MSSLVARGLRASYADVAVLHGVDLTVADGHRLGLVGPNGAGKSTLLRALAGELPLDAGSVTAVGTVGFLPQEPERLPGELVSAYLARRTGVAAADAAMQAAAEAMGTGEPGADDAYGEALDRWLSLGGADLEVRAPEVLADLGLTDAVLALPTTALSGGQMARVSLAALLLSRFDLLLLDEPTNDLDLDGLDRLERFVAGLRGGLVLVSHDREFLSRTIDRVLELDPANQRHSEFAGGWDAYLAEREIARRHARESYEEFADKRAELVGRVQSTREMSVRGAVRAKRKRPDNDRAAAGARMEGATSAAGKIRNLENRLERLDGAGVEEPRKEWVLQMELPAAGRSGDVVATLRGATVGLGAFTLGPLDLDLRAGDRVGLTGPNGAGKSTLLNLLLGRLAPSAGTAVLGANVVLGELDQVRGPFSGAASVTEVLRAATGQEEEPVRTLLAKFGLRGDHAVRPAGSLSPGERTRAGLALLMAQGTNLLVLDEPTNHLDVPAIEQLEQALETYTGTLVLVSHDRRLLEAVATTRRWHLEDGRLQVLAG